MTVNQNMMIRDGIGEEIVCYLRISFHPDLRTAEVGFKLAAGQLYIDGQHALHVSAHLNQRVVSRRQITVDGDTDTGLKMRGVLMFLGHTERQGTMRKEHLAVRLDTCRVNLET